MPQKTSARSHFFAGNAKKMSQKAAGTGQKKTSARFETVSASLLSGSQPISI